MNMTPQALQAVSDFKAARVAGLTTADRQSRGIAHHPESVRLFKFIQLHDAEEYLNHFDWRDGGDGDNGEQLMYQMDAYFELRDQEKK